jgi:hypothetical protein
VCVKLDQRHHAATLSCGCPDYESSKALIKLRPTSSNLKSLGPFRVGRSGSSRLGLARMETFWKHSRGHSGEFNVSPAPLWRPHMTATKAWNLASLSSLPSREMEQKGFEPWQIQEISGLSSLEGTSGGLERGKLSHRGTIRRNPCTSTSYHLRRAVTFLSVPPSRVARSLPTHRSEVRSRTNLRTPQTIFPIRNQGTGPEGGCLSSPGSAGFGTDPAPF